MMPTRVSVAVTMPSSRLVARLRLPNLELMLGEFWRALARLGSFIGHKSDRNPSWQRLWCGWFRLQDLCWVTSLAAHDF